MAEKIVHVKVSSSNIESVGYDEETNRMEIQFKNGGLYRYFSVPKRIFNGLKKADSVGRYFAAHVKGNFNAQKIEKGRDQ